MKILSKVVENETGLHARPAKVLVQESQRFQSKIEIYANGTCANAKSILSIISLGAVKGTEMEIRISGVDEVEAYKAINILFVNKLNEPS